MEMPTEVLDTYQILKSSHLARDPGLPVPHKFLCLSPFTTPVNDAPRLLWRPRFDLSIPSQSHQKRRLKYI